MIVGVNVRVVGAPRVIHIVLDKLEAGNSNPVERLVVRPKGCFHRDVGRTEVGKGYQPGLEDRNDRGILLGIDAPNLPTAVIDVEVGRDLGMTRQNFDGPGSLTRKGR